MRTREKVLRALEREGTALRSLGVRRLGLFGSVARGASGPASDLDFVVEFEAKSFDRYMDLKFMLERLFGCSVDLVLSDAIKPRLKPVILGEAVYAPGL
ncbi:MAG: nucleotidyltransferase family protein [Thermoanaerobaculia bacterium]